MRMYEHWVNKGISDCAAKFLRGELSDEPNGELNLIEASDLIGKDTGVGEVSFLHRMVGISTDALLPMASSTLQREVIVLF